MSLLRTILIIITSLVVAGAPQVAEASKRTVALGASITPGDRSVATYDAFRAASGRAPALWSIWSDWGQPTSVLPDKSFLDHLRAHGTVPLIIWQPVGPNPETDSSYTFDKIARGDFDPYIKQFARDVKAFGGRVLIRFAHEMEGYWFPWGMGRFTNTPKTFVRAWKHVVNIFRGTHGQNANNARFLWSPNGCGAMRPSSLAKCRSNLHSLYPGDKYVDYIGFSAFNWGSYKGRWTSMMGLYAPKMQSLAFIPRSRGRSPVIPNKPIIVTETASAPKGTRRQPGTKAAWIKTGYSQVYAAFPRIAAIVYFNVDMRTGGGKEDWRLTGSAMREYKRLLRTSKFQGRIR